MADPARKPRSRSNWRAWLRVIHRDTGYVVVGLTVVYALSGIAVNHIADWDPNFASFERTHELGAPIEGTDQQIAATVRQRLDIAEKPTDVYRMGPDELEIVLERRTLHVNATNGHVVDEGQESRGLLRLANWLHLNRGKKAWTYVADAYAAALLLLASSGLLLVPGKKGIKRRGVLLALAGIAVPVAYVLSTGGP